MLVLVFKHLPISCCPLSRIDILSSTVQIWYFVINVQDCIAMSSRSSYNWLDLDCAQRWRRRKKHFCQLLEQTTVRTRSLLPDFQGPQQWDALCRLREQERLKTPDFHPNILIYKCVDKCCLAQNQMQIKEEWFKSDAADTRLTKRHKSQIFAICAPN